MNTQPTSPQPGPDREQSDESRLERSMGLPAAIAIGLGTMIGAGIFVFPGMVAERVGALGFWSFLLAGLVALTVAIYTAELATAMPVSGGSYTFTERIFGPNLGAVVGLAQAAGLMFASAFYLAAFGQYASDLLAWFGEASPPWGSGAFALGAALALTGVNLLGGAKAGKLQTTIVIIMTVLLTGVFSYGFTQIWSTSELPLPDPEQGPQQLLDVVTTAAVIFTAFIGFVQITAVGGEVRKPERNLPFALISSVAGVLLLYLLVYFVTVNVGEPDSGAAEGQSHVVQAARVLLGPAGALTIMVAGLLATLSSANASILSASRTLFALARDGALPAVLSRVSRSFSSPWAALVCVGVPVAILSTQALDLLAEVASLLHLVIYALVCLAVAVIRRRAPDWYRPGFTVKGPILLPILASLLCLGLVLFMRPQAIAWGLGVVMISVVLHFGLKRWREQRGDN